MPWHPRDLLEEREHFVQLADLGHQPFAQLCRQFGIARQTGYKWLSRYEEGARQHTSLQDRSRRPHKIKTVSDEVRAAVLQIRSEHGWGPGKIAAALKDTGLSAARSTISRILKTNGLVRNKSETEGEWIRTVFISPDPLPTIVDEVPKAQPAEGFARKLRDGHSREQRKAMAVVAGLKGIPIQTIARSLCLAPHTIVRYCQRYASGGLKALFQKSKCKVNDEPHRSSVLAILHSPPATFGINRATWKMVDLQNTLALQGHRLSESRIRRIIKAGGYRWRRARVVLTSKDPDYQTKLDAVKQILANLAPDQAFFSIDEYGPFAVKQKPGRKLVAPGSVYVVPQYQKSKGWMIITAALELSRSHVTHFYSRKKDTEEMIKMTDLLRSQYRKCSRIYLSWDAASWHISKKLLAHVKELNTEANREHSPFVELAPLPAGAQFLNVIESIFSGMSRAIIRNSDYPSLESAKSAIDRYFEERNAYFAANPKRAGNKIWGQERVPSAFHEGQNCKDPDYR